MKYERLPEEGYRNWSVPDGSGYKRAEKMFYCQQLGMSLRKIGLRFEVSAERVRSILLKRQRKVEAYLQSKANEEKRYGSTMTPETLSKLLDEV